MRKIPPGGIYTIERLTNGKVSSFPVNSSLAGEGGRPPNAARLWSSERFPPATMGIPWIDALAAFWGSFRAAREGGL